MNLAASVAQSESESISEKLKWNFKQKTAQGKFYANRNKYFGYDAKGDEFNENEVYVEDMIFRKTPSRNVITGEIDEDWKPKCMKNHHVEIVSRET